MAGKNIILCNHVSEPLNALLYIYNIFQNQNSTPDHIGFFPNYKFERGLISDAEKFNQTFQSCWNEMLALYSGENDTINYLLESKTYYVNFIKKLFQDNQMGEDCCNEIMKTFVCWWWSDPYGGRSMLESISDMQIPEIGDALFSQQSSRFNESATMHFFLVIVFRSLPLKLLTTSNILHVVPLDHFVPVSRKNRLDPVLEDLRQILKLEGQD